MHRYEARNSSRLDGGSREVRRLVYLMGSILYVRSICAHKLSSNQVGLWLKDLHVCNDLSYRVVRNLTGSVGKDRRVQSKGLSPVVNLSCWGSLFRSKSYKHAFSHGISSCVCLDVSIGSAPAGKVDITSVSTMSRYFGLVSSKKKKEDNADAVVSEPATMANVPSGMTSPTAGFFFSRPASSIYINRLSVRMKIYV